MPDHGLELAGSVGSVLPGQAAILVVDDLQLGQTFIHLPLEALKKKRIFSLLNQNNPSSSPLQTDLKFHKFFFGEREGNVCRAGVGSSSLRDLQPVLKARVVVEEFAPESPRLLDPDGGATLLHGFTFS